MKYLFFASLIVSIFVLVQPVSVAAFIEGEPHLSSALTDGSVVVTMTNPVHGQTLTAGEVFRFTGNETSYTHFPQIAVDNMYKCTVAMSINQVPQSYEDGGYAGYPSIGGPLTGFAAAATLTKSGSTATCSWDQTVS
ncbi:MAG: hypothetical protein HYW88_00460, partial [Candidatus Sungbacteria bacterium]|nr:hypothetical protein [Candidatus Sungbacteria bacterium]